MNAVEDEVVELVSAVLARMVFRLLRHADPRNRFPVHLLLEEAHRYVASTPSRYAMDAGRIFERISKEGRKYGLFLLVASQRPSELSKTVLSQCSNFVVHRIQNPDDLSQIRQMTPFISDAVLRRLPSLPKQHALVFGNSVNLPTTFKVRSAFPLPASDDAKIVDLWFHEAGRPSLLRFGSATTTLAADD
ncbi:ATP-binding protein [Bradyrhizobium sp. LeoA1S1]